MYICVLILKKKKYEESKFVFVDHYVGIFVVLKQ